MELEVDQVSGYLTQTDVGKTREWVQVTYDRMRWSMLGKLKDPHVQRTRAESDLTDRAKQGRCREDPSTCGSR